MSIEKRKRWLRDIVANIDRITLYVKGLDQASFEHDEKTIDAVERCFQRIAEAAHRLGDQAVEWMPTHDWKGMHKLGNVLRHHYDNVNMDIIWGIITLDLPALRHDCVKVLERLEADQGSA